MTLRAERVGIPVRAALWAGVVLLLLGGVRLYLLHGQAILLDLRSLSGMFCF